MLGLCGRGTQAQKDLIISGCLGVEVVFFVWKDWRARERAGTDRCQKVESCPRSISRNSPVDTDSIVVLYAVGSMELWRRTFFLFFPKPCFLIAWSMKMTWCFLLLKRQKEEEKAEGGEKCRDR